MAYSDTVLADSPVAYYRFGEGSGATMLDSSGNSRNGTYLNGAVPSATSLLRGDSGNSALTLDGVDDYASVPAATWMQLTNAWSCEFWFKPNTVSGDHIVVGRVDYGFPFSNTNWSFGFHQTNNQLTLNFFYDNSASYIPLTYTGLVAGAVHHVVGTYDGTTIRLYINGTQVTSAAHTGTLNTAPAMNLTFGSCHNNDTASRFAGTLDEVALYGSVLSAARVSAHYSVGSTPAAGASLSGGGALTADGQVYRLESTAAPSGSGTLAADGQVVRREATAAFGGDGGVAVGTGVQIQTATAALGGDGALTSSGEVATQDAAAGAQLSSQGTLQAHGQIVLPPGGMRRWIFYDPRAAQTWQVPINPNSMDSPYAARSLTMAHGSRLGPDRVRAIDGAPSGPAQWTFGGVIRTKDHHDQLRVWASKNTPIQITDHLDRTFEVVVQSFDPVDRRPTATVAWRLTFKMTCLVLREIK